MTQTPEHELAHAARRYFDLPLERLNERQRRVLHRTVTREPLSGPEDEDSTFGQRLADRVAAVGGSWGFIIAFAVVLATWVAGNILLAARAFDPYPFIFLNLMLSMLAAIQAPIIMMSQNRQSAKDRLAAAHDYEVNLKAEIEILALHDKLDQLRTQDIEALVARQNEQIALLTRLLQEKSGR